MTFLEDNGSTFLLVAGIGLVIAILLRRSSRYRKKQKRQARKEKPAAGFGKSASAKRREPLLDAPPEITRWQVEMHEVARELKAEVDSKLIALQTLLGMIRQEADRLEDILARLEPLAGSAADGIREELDEARQNSDSPSQTPPPKESDS